MKTKQYLIFMTDKKGVVLLHVIISAEDMDAVDTYYAELKRTEKYKAFSKLVANKYFIEILEHSDAAALPTINGVLLVNCSDKKLTRTEIRVVVEMQDGKSVKDGALKLCMADRTLGKHISHINEKTDKDTLKLSIAFLKTPKTD